MRVLCCYINLDPRTEISIKKQASADWVFTGRSDNAYWEAIVERWTGVDDLMVIEHDNGLRGGEVDSFIACDQLWCSYAYGYPGHSEAAVSSSLGCTKFSAALQRMVSLGTEPQHWVLLDLFIHNAIVAVIGGPGRPHVHGTVDHFRNEANHARTSVLCGHAPGHKGCTSNSCP